MPWTRLCPRREELELTGVLVHPQVRAGLVLQEGRLGTRVWGGGEVGREMDATRPE